jgi:hypothetical protein
VTVRSSAVPVAALRALGLAASLALAACEDEQPAGPRTEPDSPAAPQAPPPEARRGDRHARAAARHAPRLREVSGTIVRADGRRLAIRSGAGPEVTLRVGPGTAVTVRGRLAGVAALRPGDDVRASYQTAEGAPATALSVEVVPPPAAPARPPPPPSPPAPSVPPGPAGDSG